MRPARLLPYLHYPAVVTTTFALFAWLQSRGASLIVSTYVPVLLAAAMVTLLELKFPHRSEWRPAGQRDQDRPRLHDRRAARLSAADGFRVHVRAHRAGARARPADLRALAARLADLDAGGAHDPGRRLSALLAPSRRAQNDTLWRLHSVHHSVEQMYWLNTARFHLIEKALQMTLDSLPFLLMAVDPTVLALYYVAYATNGFFQHCNIELRYGFLNYIVGSAETHRWHHSRIPRESNANYGNTVIVWDLLFGTWFLPRERAVAAARPAGSRLPEVVLGADARAVHPLTPDAGIRIPRGDGGVRGTILEAPRAARRAPPDARRSACCATSSGPIAPRISASSIASRRSSTPEDFRRACRSRTTRRCVPTSTPALHRRAGADARRRRCSTHRRAARPARPSTFRLRASTLRMHRAEQALFTYLQYRACPPRSRARRWASWAPRSRAGSTPVTTSGRCRATCTSRCRPLCSRRFVVPPGVSAIADYDLKYLVDPAARARVT